MAISLQGGAISLGLHIKSAISPWTQGESKPVRAAASHLLAEQYKSSLPQVDQLPLGLTREALGSAPGLQGKFTFGEQCRLQVHQQEVFLCFVFFFFPLQVIFLLARLNKLDASF